MYLKNFVLIFVFINVMFNGCTIFNQIEELKKQNDILSIKNNELLSKNDKLSEEYSQLSEAKVKVEIEKKTLKEEVQEKIEKLDASKKQFKELYHKWVGDPNKLYSITEASLQNMENLGCPLSKEQQNRLNDILQKKSSNELTYEVNKIVESMNIDSMEKDRYISCIANSLASNEPYIEVTVSQEIQKNLKKKSTEIPIVPYNHVNFKLNRTRIYADKHNFMWKNSYSNKVFSYFKSKQDYQEKENEVEKCKTILQGAYNELFDYEKRIKNIELKIQKKQKKLEETQQILKDQVASKNLHVLLYTQAKYSNHIKKGVALTELENLAKNEAIKVLNRSIIEGYSYITNNIVVRDVVRHTIAGIVTKVPNTEQLYFDDYDFNDGKQMIYAIFHFEVNNQKMSHQGTKKIRNLLNRNRYISQYKVSKINESNKESFVFPIDLATRVNRFIRLTEKKNLLVQRQLKKIRNEYSKKLRSIIEELNALGKEKNVLIDEKRDYRNSVVRYKTEDLRNSCKSFIDSESKMNKAYTSAYVHGKNKLDGNLYFVLFNEKSITLEDSADSVTKQLVDELYNEIKKSLNTAFIKQVTEIENSILSRYSLEIDEVRNGKVEEASLILRTQRRSGLQNFFGLGLMFTVRGHVTFTDSYKLKSGFKNVNDCFEHYQHEAIRNASN